eukprot:TRINITY_DN69658_c0_g1_i1.p1 TRINITY_DN69658_c0_g1~~TRINITY_DN69658_c0_g1_i1.p1  ORF type:complete len:216 (+),score=24.13 TRINITY_DN69658_c0_g1_i1:29-676(+)
MLRLSVLALLLGSCACSYYNGYWGPLSICFRQTENDTTQCQGLTPGEVTCSGAMSWTKPFRDDTDNRNGGCTYQWELQNNANHNIQSHVYQLCFRNSEDSSQCSFNGTTCTQWVGAGGISWTTPFRDDTDNRPGGCSYQWLINSRAAPNVTEYRVDKCRVHFLESEGSSQCEGSRRSMSGWSTAANWTAPFRDDTDGRPGGCTYQWGLECTSNQA